MPVHDLDLAAARVYALPLVDTFRGLRVREGVVVPGPAGWGDFCPFPEYGDDECVPWLAAAVEAAAGGWPPPVRADVAVNVTVPAVSPQRARDIVAAAGWSTAKVKVADRGGSHTDDTVRVEAVRDALGPAGAVRVDANGAWGVDEAVAAIRDLDRAAGGLEYVEQPCAHLEDLAAVRRRVDVPVAADESVRRAEDPLRVALAGAADLVVVKAAPLGGVARALDVVAAAGLPVVVSSAAQSGVGLAGEVALAAAVPALAGACGLGTGRLLAGDVVAPDALEVREGRVAAPLGTPVPDPDALDRWEQRDPSRREWWLRRLRRVAALAATRT